MNCVKMSKQHVSKTEADTLEITETWRILKNVVVISLAFMVHFTAYSGVSYLQSSINFEAGLGTASLAAVYVGVICSNMFLPALIIKWLGTKWTICLSLITYMPYIAAQLKPTFYTMIPAALCVGLGAGPLWCAKNMYLIMVSEAHSKLSKISAATLLVRFLGLFFMIFRMSVVWGNLTSSLVISSNDNAAAVTSLNASLIPELCGANFLPTADAHNALPSQPREKIQIIAGIYLACMACAALLVAGGVDSMKRYEGRETSAPSGVPVIIATLKLVKEPNLQLLIIINTFIGFQEAFFGVDFTEAFVSCAMGTGSIGYITVAFGLAFATGSVVTGYLGKLSDRLPLICTATTISAGLFITLLTWRPQPGLEYMLYIIAVLWGLSDCIWTVQMNAYNGMMFPGREVAAFSNYSICLAVGHITAYGSSAYLRTRTKIFLMIALLIFGFIGYLLVEVRNRKSKQALDISGEVKGDVTIIVVHDKGCDNIAFQTIEEM